MPSPPTRLRILQEATETTEKMTSHTDRFSNSDFWTEDNQENEARNVREDWVFVTFVSFCKNPKGSAGWYDSVLSVSSCKILFERSKNPSP
jgi:hypothetical protein